MFDRNFIASKFTRNGGWLYSLREANDETREVVGYALEDKVLERTPLKDAEVSMLFTYMHRRFGLPSLGGDDYKDLSAGWLITTPMDDLALIVSPSFAGMGFSFRPVVSLPAKGRDGLQEITGERLQAMVSAYERTLLDFLRPVIQRDMDFNVLGEISDKNPVPDWHGGEDDDVYDRLPRYHETCGLPMPDGIFGNKDWQQLLALLGRMGGGDIAKGMEVFVLEAEERAFENARKARPEILPIIAAGFFLAGIDNAREKISALGVDAEDKRVGEFVRGAYGNGGDAPPSDWFMSVTEADIRESVELVSAFGVGTHYMTKGVENIAREQRYTIEWARFVEISDREFDEDLIPDVQYITGAAVEEWRRNVAASGDTRLSEWAEELAGDVTGRQTLARILSVLHFEKVKAARDAEKALQ